MKRIIMSTLLLITSLQAMGQTKDPFRLNNYGGIYQDDSGVKYIVNPSDAFPHFTIMNSGETHMIRQKEANIFEYSSTRNNWDSIGGVIEFETEDGQISVCIVNKNKVRTCANRIPLSFQELSLSLENDVLLSGDLIQATKSKSNLVAVLLHGDGDNDRYDLFDIGMYLVSEGYAVFAFDKRNVGKSTGPEVEGNGYDEISRVYASDAVQLVTKLKQDYPKNDFGVIGVSQGGWIGSIVSQKVPIAFYVNIAGSISLGWQQWQHYMISYLKRSGFSKEDIMEAEDYFKTFFDVGLQNTSFSTYLSKLSAYKEKRWFKRLETRKLIEWKDEATAIEVVGRNSNNPSLDIKKVNSPALGIFYEFDHSTPSNSPTIFFNSLQESNSRDISVRVFPNATHGGWVVDNYYFDTSKITNVESKAYYFIVDWLNSLKR